MDYLKQSKSQVLQYVAFIPAPVKQREADLCESEASLVYIVSYRLYREPLIIFLNKNSPRVRYDGVGL